MTICTSPLTAALSLHLSTSHLFFSGPFSRRWELPCRGTWRMIKVQGGGVLVPLKLPAPSLHPLPQFPSRTSPGSPGAALVLAEELKRRLPWRAPSLVEGRQSWHRGSLWDPRGQEVQLS